MVHIKDKYKKNKDKKKGVEPIRNEKIFGNTIDRKRLKKSAEKSLFSPKCRRKPKIINLWDKKSKTKSILAKKN
jgi:hypothetical protein